MKGKKKRSPKMVADGFILGIDEVGRGPAAGPVTVAAVLLPDGCRIRGLNDSKLLTRNQRHDIAIEVKNLALAVGIGWTSAEYIDRYGLTAAMNLAASRAINQIRARYDFIILDGIHNYLTSEEHTEPMVKADQSVACVAAASVVAKVARDNYMELIDKRYPEYGFASHKGYMTLAHQSAMQRHGLSPIHRRRWSNVGQLALNI